MPPGVVLYTEFNCAFSNLKRAMKTCKLLRDKELCKYILSLASNKYMQQTKPFDLIRCNKSFYRHYYITFGIFKIGLYSNIMSAWLLLASFMYQQERFRECIDIINYGLSKCTPDVISSYSEHNLKQHNYFHRMKQSYGLLVTCKKLYFQNINFHYPFSFWPKELTLLDDNEAISISPVVYSYVLSSLCCHHLRDVTGKLNAIRDLKSTLDDIDVFNPNRETWVIKNACFFKVKQLV